MAGTAKIVSQKETHEGCRAVCHQLVSHLVQQKKERCVCQGGNITTEELLKHKDEEIQRLKENRDNLRIQLNQAELQIWNSRNLRNIPLLSISGLTPSEYSAVGNLGSPLDKSNVTNSEGKASSKLEVDGPCESIGVFPSGITGMLPSVTALTKPAEDLSVKRALKESCSLKSGDAPVGLKSVDASFRNTRPEVSADLVNKLISQNGRLKKIMRDILAIKGLTLTDYLNKEEYEDIIEQLRQDLSCVKSERDELRKIIASGNSISDLQKVCSEQVTKISQLLRSVVIQKTLAESFSQQYENLKAEHSNCKAQIQLLEQQLVRLKGKNSLQEAERILAESKKKLSENQQKREHAARTSINQEIDTAKSVATAAVADNIVESSVKSTAPVPVPSDNTTSSVAASNQVGHATIASITAAPIAAIPTVAPQRTSIPTAAAPRIVGIQGVSSYRPAVSASNPGPGQSCSAAVHKMERKLPWEKQTLDISTDGSDHEEHSDIKNRRDDRDDSDDDIGDDYEFFCPRCEKQFRRSQKGQFDAHAKKCVD